MSFAPPPGPPPPSVPEGWKSQYDDRYKQWFFVNLHTGKSQWERLEGPAQKEEQHAPPSGPPPSYDDSGPANPSVQAAATDDKKTLGSNNPYNQADPSNDTLESDARLAAQLQAEEDARAQSRSPVHPGAAADYYSGSSRPLSSAGYQPSQGPAPAPEPKRSRGFLSKLMGKSSSSSGSPHFGRPPIAQQQSYGYQQGGYYGGGYPPQPHPAGYGYPQYQPQGGHYPGAVPPRRGGGMGTAGAAALGVGGGLLGGALLAEAFDDDHGDTIINNYGDNYSGDFGGGDDFGDF
ncbi:WW domain-containing protein [Aspergillus fumigatus Z5]|nr:WW domain-containing protein [Aspergillus fumigatus Z5]